MATSTGDQGHVYEARHVPRWLSAAIFAVVGLLWLGTELLVVAEASRAGESPSPAGMFALLVMAIIVGAAAWATAQALGRSQLFLTRGGLVYQRAGGALSTSWDNVASIEPGGPDGAPIMRLRAPRVAHRTTPLAPAGDHVPLYRFDYRPGSALYRDLQALAPRLFPGTARYFG